MNATATQPATVETAEFGFAFDAPAAPPADFFTREHKSSAVLEREHADACPIAPSDTTSTQVYLYAKLQSAYDELRAEHAGLAAILRGYRERDRAEFASLMEAMD
jgi:hypothetical protein